MGVIGVLLYIGIIVLYIAGMWKAFEKAGKPGWAAIVPIYNIIVMIEIAKKPLWWIILCLIPIANIVILIMINIEIAQNFRKGAGFGLGLAFLGFIFWPLLGFGDDRYIYQDNDNPDVLDSGL